MWPFLNERLSSLVTSIFLVTTLFAQPSLQQHPIVGNPCRLAKGRYNHQKSTPFIRIIDEVTGQGPDIVLGASGLPFYTLLPTTPTPIVVECSSGFGPVAWSYRGRGATSGLKIVSSTWTKPNQESLSLQPNCYSAALVISNVTDQLTGEYSCRSVILEGQKDAKKQFGSSFVLFAPQSSPFYYPEGDEVKVTLASLQEPALTLPCVSKRRSGAGIGLYKEIFETDTNKTRLERLELGSRIRYDPFIGFQLLKPNQTLFDSKGTANFTCKFESNLKHFGNLENRTLLRVVVHLRPEEKIAPESSPVTSFSPYFSWTSLSQPVIELEQSTGSVTPSEWQQIYTKNSFEEGNTSAPIFHLGSFNLLNGKKGSEGRVILRKKGNGQIIHEWEYKVLDKDKEPFVGLSYSHDPQEGRHHVFTCVSATKSSPNLTFKNLMTDEVAVIDGYAIVECPDHPDTSLGCRILTTTIPMGEVTCIGDGVDTTVRYPLGFVEPSRPFFIERGQLLQLTVDEKDVVVTLPCLTNSPEAQTIVHLFRKQDKNDTGDNEVAENWKQVWPPLFGVDPAEVGIEFYPDWGFHLDTSNPIWANPAGEYLCSSSEDAQDQSDAVRVIVTKRGWSVSPKEVDITGGLPYSLRWAWSGQEAIVVKEFGLQDHVTVKLSNPGERRWTKAELLLTPEIFAGFLLQDTVINVTLIQNGQQIHQWKFSRIPSSHSLGLTMNTSWDNHQAKINPEAANSSIEIICRGSPTLLERDRPRLSYYICQNKASCELIKKCQDKNCNSDHGQENEMESEDCSKENGCLRQVLKSIPLNGFLTAVCKYNGLTETGTVFDVFFREDVNWEFGNSAEELVFLSANAATTEQNPAREVVDLGSNLVWELGESVSFTCGASPASFSQGIRWAVEDDEGTLHFQPQDLHDPQWKYSASTQLLSTFTFHVINSDVKKIWCFVPSLADDKNQVIWKNLSQPVFIRGEIEENCHDIEPSIRLISVYPPPSVLFNANFSLSELRLDKLGSFVVPKGLLQFGVRITTPEPVEWSFIQAGRNNKRVVGPSSTPQVQSDRAMTNFYDSSTYCYTSKLLVNLRAKDAEMDTGTYIAKFGDKTLRFHLYVPNDKQPYLINSGSEINITLRDDGITEVPCLLNNPNIGVKLFKQKSDELSYDEVSKPSSEYDPSKGFTFTPSTELLGTWKCVAGENPEDFVVINVLPIQKKQGGLKYELVGDIHVFTCNSVNETKPVLNMTNTDENSNSSLLSFERKDCFGGCSIIMTTESKGHVYCLGDGVNATYILDGQRQDHQNNETDDETETKTGIWFDSKAKAFKCRLNSQSKEQLKNNSSTHPNLIGVTCRRPEECKILQGRLQQRDHDEATTTTTGEHCGLGCTLLNISELEEKPSYRYSSWFSVFLRCNDVFAQFFLDRGVIHSATKESVTAFKRVRLDVVSFRSEGSGGMFQAKLRCFANRYFYSRGISWGLEKADGTLQFQDHSAAVEVEVQSFNSIMSEIRLEFDEVQQFKRMWCFVPILSSTQWANSSISIPIKELTHNLQ